MADFLRSLSPFSHAMLVIFVTMVLRGMVLSWWDRKKARWAAMPTPMKLKNGVYVAWGPAERWDRFMRIFSMVWLVYIAIIIVGGIYLTRNGAI